MTVFVSWSGETSRRIAEAVRSWIPKVIQVAQPWMSERDISAGQRWSDEIASQLEQNAVGVICLTPENLDKPWLHFEAGALSKTRHVARVIPLLFQVQDTSVQGPLAQFQAAQLDKEGMWQVIKSIYEQIAEPTIQENVIRDTFEAFWPQLEKLLVSLESKNSPAQSALTGPSTQDLLSETLRHVRDLVQRGEPQRRPSMSGSGTDAARIAVHWYRDLVSAADLLESDLSFREYQMELRGLTDTETYRRIQREMLLMESVTRTLRSLEIRGSDQPKTGSTEWARSQNLWSAWIEGPTDELDSINVTVNMLGELSITLYDEKGQPSKRIFGSQPGDAETGELLTTLQAHGIATQSIEVLRELMMMGPTSRMEFRFLPRSWRMP